MRSQQWGLRMIKVTGQKSRFWRSALAMGVSAALLLGCAQDEAEKEIGQIGYVGGFYGGVTADEPQATIVGRDILTVGGSAADAAVAMGFALAVTMPVRAGLGAEGVCLVHDPSLAITEALDFLAPPPSSGALAVPAFARGMAVLHARYGRLDWRGVLRAAENLARIGHRASRATRTDLEQVWSGIQRDPFAVRALSGAAGGPPNETETWRQADLAAVLTQIRLKGAGTLYTGPLARTVTEAYRSVGGGFDTAELGAYVPKWRLPISTKIGPNRVFAAPSPAAGGMIAHATALIAELGDLGAPGDAAREQAIMRALQQSFSTGGAIIESGEAFDEEATLSETAIEAAAEAVTASPSAASAPKTLPARAPDRVIDDGATGFVAVDSQGMAVACTLSLNGIGGGGRMILGFGFYPAKQREGYFWNTPVIAANDISARFFYAATGDGGAAGLSALARVSASSFLRGGALRDALAEPRIALDPRGVRVGLEPNSEKPVADALSEIGFDARRMPLIGRIHAVHCPSGLPIAAAQRRCAAEVDPRSDGLSALAQ